MVIVGNQAVSGPAGNDGSAATVTVGTTTTGAAGTNASVTNSGTTSAAVFNFTIPRGATGDTGPNSVTSATTTNIDGILAGDSQNIYELNASSVPVAEAVVLYNENAELQASGFFCTDDNGGINLSNADSSRTLELQHGLNIAHILYDGSLLDLNIQGLGNYTQTFPTGTGKFALTQAANGEPDKLSNGTIAGTLTVNSTTYTYGTGAAAAMNAATGELRRVKLTNETRTAAATVIDNTLQASVDAGGHYQFEIQLYIRATGAATFSHGIFFNGTLANTSAGERFGLLQTWFTSSASNSVLAWSAVTPPTCNFSATGAPDGWLLRYIGTLQVANTGTFGLQYANAAGTGTIVAKAGSYMILNKLNV